jgi:hypothetical protein
LNEKVAYRGLVDRSLQFRCPIADVRDRQKRVTTRLWALLS